MPSLTGLLPTRDWPPSVASCPTTAADFVGYGRWDFVARIAIIPEPATAVLLLGGLLLARRRR